jgi:hypothetical protein
MEEFMVISTALMMIRWLVLWVMWVARAHPRAGLPDSQAANRSCNYPQDITVGDSRMNWGQLGRRRGRMRYGKNR